jgi:hypothetical protein
MASNETPNWRYLEQLTEPPDLTNLEINAALEKLEEWFFENFEDPVENTPYESAEGGYNYIWGGPFETRDIFEHVYGDSMSEELKDAIVRRLEHSTDAWVPNSGRVNISNGDDERDNSVTGEAAYEKVQEAIRSLEVLAEAPVLVPGIGHNRPPEPLTVPPFNEADQAELAQALQVLKTQPLEPRDNGKAAEDAKAVVQTKMEKLRGWLFSRGELFTDEALKEAGKQFGKWAPRVFWSLVVDRMFHVIETVTHWLNIVFG